VTSHARVPAAALGDAGTPLKALIAS